MLTRKTVTPQLYYFICNTTAGWVGILGSTKGLRRVTLPRRSEHEARQLLGASLNRAVWSPHLFQDLMERFKEYFSGYKVTFPDMLDLSGATAFQRRVWETTRLIPYGETLSYACIAVQIRKPGAARAVGQALGRNPLPVIVPCHRVIDSNGGLGGFSGGLEMKRFLLNLEGLVAF